MSDPSQTTPLASDPMALREANSPVVGPYLAMRATLTTTAAKTMIATAEALAEKNGWALAMGLLDSAGNPLAMLAMDGVQPIAIETAWRKAKAALLNQTSSEPTGKIGMFLADARGPVLLNQLGLFPEGGGLPIVVGGHVIGAFAVGGRGPVDEVCAKAGIDALAP